MEAIWSGQPLTAAEVHKILSRHKKWHLKTVGTFLGRLAEKEVLEVHREGKVNTYTARITREACVRQESESFLQRVFQGAFAPMMAHFVEHAELSENDIAQLKTLLDKRPKKKKSRA